MTINVRVGDRGVTPFNTPYYAAAAILAVGPNRFAADTVSDATASVSWHSTDATAEHEVTMLVCGAWGVPARTMEEYDIEAGGGTPDRPVHLFGTTVYPADFLD